MVSSGAKEIAPPRPGGLASAIGAVPIAPGLSFHLERLRTHRSACHPRRADRGDGVTAVAAFPLSDPSCAVVDTTHSARIRVSSGDCFLRPTAKVTRLCPAHPIRRRHPPADSTRQDADDQAYSCSALAGCYGAASSHLASGHGLESRSTRCPVIGALTGMRWMLYGRGIKKGILCGLGHLLPSTHPLSTLYHHRLLP